MTRFFAPRPLALLLCAVGALTSLNALAFQQSGQDHRWFGHDLFPLRVHGEQ